MHPIILRLPVKMLPQPDETTCGPTCLHAVYRYWGEEVPLAGVIARTRKLEHGGTFAIFLACDALRQGYQATIYSYNLTVFDPTWFAPGGDIAERLERQREEKKHDARLQHVTEGYLEFLRLGGRLRLTDLSRPLIRGLLRRNLPIITGLSSTYLYRAAREYGPDDVPDDIRGLPAGHFVVIAGYDRKKRSVLVADPYGLHPYSPSHEYWVSIDRVIGAVLLGIVTHDANLLVIYPPQAAPKGAA
ncbi:MAG: C39 family peptidase [Gammaproteobacteria bacterium]|nr:C39 family peptidase [Gammaproteobacteria bacterium]